MIPTDAAEQDITIPSLTELNLDTEAVAGAEEVKRQTCLEKDTNQVQFPHDALHSCVNQCFLILNVR